MQIALISNDAYLRHINTLIKNIIAFNRQQLSIFLLHDIAEEGNSVELNKLRSELAVYSNLELETFYIDSQQLFDLGMCEDESKRITNIRLMLATLPIKGRVFYLDSDVIVTGDLSSLFVLGDEDVLKGKSLAAVCDPCTYQERYNTYPYFNDRFIPEIKEKKFGYNGNIYFNAGVFVIDLDLVRENGKKLGLQQDMWSGQFRKYFDRELFTHDQDFLNLVHNDDKSDLAAKYNTYMKYVIGQRFYLNLFGWFKAFTKLPQEEQNYFLEKAKANFPIVLHFLEKRKQWDCVAPEWTDLYNFFAKQSIEQIISKPVAYYEQLIYDFIVHYDYLLVFATEIDVSYLEYSKDYIKKLQRQVPWSFPQHFINNYFIKPQNFLQRLKFGLFGKLQAQLKFNEKLYQTKAKFNFFRD